MTHLKILGIKFISITVTVMALFSMFANATLGNLLLIGLITTAATYLLGDMIILRKFGNIAASLSDFVLSFISYWVLSSLFIGGSEAVLMVSLAAAFFTACVEPFIHEYISTQLFPNRVHHSRQAMNQLQTEFAEEMEDDKEKTLNYQKRHK